MSPTTKILSSSVFTDSYTGWIAGNQGNIFNTTNNGVAWDTLMRVGFPINSVMFIDSLNGFSSGGRFDWLGFVNYSINGGWHWTNPQSVDLEIMFDVVFLNKSFGITVGGDHDFFGSLAYQTFDGGKTWIRQPVTDSVPSPLTAISFIDENHAWICGYGKIYKVDPSVQTWELQTDTLTRWTWYDNSFTASELGWFAGAYGKILRYDNTPISVKDPSAQPQKFFLYPNYPNPFNPSTMIRSRTAEPATAEITIYNILGQRVKTIYSGHLPAGEHAWLWNGTNQKNSPVSSGVYIYQLKINHRIAGSRKMLLIR